MNAKTWPKKIFSNLERKGVPRYKCNLNKVEFPNENNNKTTKTSMLYERRKQDKQQEVNLQKIRRFSIHFNGNKDYKRKKTLT